MYIPVIGSFYIQYDTWRQRLNPYGPICGICMLLLDKYFSRYIESSCNGKKILIGPQAYGPIVTQIPIGHAF